MRSNRAALLGVLLVVVAVPFPNASWAEQDLAQELVRRLDEVDSLIVEGQWRKASRKCGRVEKDVVASILTGGSHLLARVAVCRSLTAQARGDEREGSWFWSVAEALEPSIAEAVKPVTDGVEKFRQVAAYCKEQHNKHDGRTLEEIRESSPEVQL